MKSWLCTALMALTLVGAAASAETFYKWQDAEGVTHYGALPPIGVEAEPVNTRTGSGTAAVTPAPAVAEPRQEQEAFAEQLDATRKARDAELAKACADARAARLSFEAKHRIRLKQADGSYKMLSQEEKMAEIEKIDQQIEDYCNPQ